jgi:fucose permease
MNQQSHAGLEGTQARAWFKPIYAGFVLTGVVTTLLGPMIPILSAKWGIGDDGTGYLFTAQFIGALSGTLAAGGLFTRIGYLRPIAIAFLLMSAGTIGLALAPWPAGLGAVLTYGVGLGIVVPGINLYVAETEPGRRAAALNVLNFLWGVGAVGGPPLIAFLSKTRGIILPHVLLAVLLAITGVIIVSGYRGSEPPASRSESVMKTESIFSRRGTAIGIAVFIFLYVGMENSIGGWAATYAGRITEWPEAAWPLAPLVFWGAVMAGRGLAPTVLRRISEGRLVFTALLGAVAGNVVIMSAVSGTTLLCGVLIAGLGFATIYPMTVATLTRLYGAGAARVASFVFGMAALGGATLPWAVGFCSARLGSLRLGLLVPLIASIAMIGLQMSIASASRITEQSRELTTGRRLS